MYREGATVPPLFETAAGTIGAGYVSGWLVVTATSIAFKPVTGVGWTLPIEWAARILPCSIASHTKNGVRIEDMRGAAYELLVADPLETTRVIGALLESR